jgi:Xaa-Pro aminopeptidase
MAKTAVESGTRVYSVAERVNTPISDGELERRWSAMRSMMEERSIDALLIQAATDSLGGYLKYFTDVPAHNGFPSSVVFPRDDLMTFVSHGSFDGVMDVSAGGDGLLRGTERVLTNPYFLSVNYTREYDAKLIAQALEPYSRATIGLVAPQQLSSACLDFLRATYPAATFVECGDPVDAIKAIKSAEEWELLRRTATLQDSVMDSTLRNVEPGMRESDIAALAQHTAQGLGSEGGAFIFGSAPPGQPAQLQARHTQDRVVEAGDQVTLLLECNGPGGLFVHLGRVCVLGKAPQRMVEELEFALEARRFTLDLIQPGAVPAEIWDAYNAFMRDHGRPEESRLHCHGQGYDLVERPLIRKDETMAIAAGMNLGCHPMYVKDGAFNYISDNYRVGDDGIAERLHAYPEKITEL